MNHPSAIRGGIFADKMGQFLPVVHRMEHRAMARN